eukprot:207532_1
MPHLTYHWSSFFGSKKILPALDKKLYRSSDCQFNEIITHEHTSWNCKHKKNQILVFSFHVERYDEIRCYMYWNGGGIRFCETDFIHILPELFVSEFKNNSKFKMDEKVKKYDIYNKNEYINETLFSLMYSLNFKNSQKK